MIKYALFFVFSAFVVLATTLYFKLGYYKEVKLTPPSEYTFKMLYKKHTGAYHKINNDIQMVENWARKNNVPCEQTFGEFLDDPKSAEEDRLRSHVGCIVSTSPPENLPIGLYYKEVSPKMYLKASFKGSPAVGPFKVYPLLENWFEENRQPKKKRSAIEVYTIINSDSVKTEYYMPL